MTRRLVRLGVLMALGLALHAVEAAIALPVLLPGAKLGLANVATLLVLAQFGPGAAAVFGIVRHVVGSLVTGMFLTPPFWLGLGGSLAVALVLLAAGRRVGLRTTGVLAGAAFQVGQGGALVALAGSWAVAAYVPPLLALGVGAGWLTGVLAGESLRVVMPGQATGPDRSGAVAGALLAGVLVLSFFGTGAASGPAQRARVYVAGREVMTLNLTETQTLPLEGGHMLIQTAPGRVRVLESDCPDKVCVRTGWVSRPGGTIVCAPYRVLITLEGGSGSDLDGVVY